MKGHNRFPAFEAPENDESVQVVTFAKQPLLNCLHLIPAAYLWGVLGNDKLHECCRDVENLGLEIRKTQPDLEYSDLYVIQCECGRNHRRLLGDPGQLGKTKPKKNFNPLFEEANHAS